MEFLFCRIDNESCRGKIIWSVNMILLLSYYQNFHLYGKVKSHGHQNSSGNILIIRDWTLRIAVIHFSNFLIPKIHQNWWELETNSLTLTLKKYLHVSKFQPIWIYFQNFRKLLIRYRKFEIKSFQSNL